MHSHIQISFCQLSHQTLWLPAVKAMHSTNNDDRPCGCRILAGRALPSNSIIAEGLVFLPHKSKHARPSALIVLYVISSVC